MTPRFHLALLLFFTAFFLVSTVVSNQFDLNLKSLDIFTQTHQPHPDITIIAIDAKSLDALGRWPWSRQIHANLVTKLQDYEPSVVAFDVTFTHSEAEGSDKAFGQSLEEAKFPIVLAEEAIYQKGTNQPQRFTEPLPELSHHSNVSLGHVMVPLGRDGIARTFPKVITQENASHVPLTYRVAEQVKATVPKGNALVNFTGPAGTFPTYSASDVLNGGVPKEALQHKIVLIGATASDLRDTVLVPYKTPVMAGVEWFANILDNLLLRRSIAVLPAVIPWLIGDILGLVYWWFLPRRKTRELSIGLAITFLALPIASFIAWRSGWALSYFANVLFLGGLILFHGLYHWYIAEAEKRRLRQTFQYYFSPQVMEEILKDPNRLKLGGQKREMTIMFSDIRSFTTITESLPPERLTQLLHEYFNEMMAGILATNGVVDKFIGDAIMAFWGAPIEQPNQADLAVMAALGMMERLTKAQQKWLADGYPLVDIGIGINTGVVTLGNMGSDSRFDYTVIGDDVNAASRLEGLNKEYKSHIIISESTKKKLTIPVKTKLLGEVIVKGKTKPLKIYEVLEK